jgi:hypothetical protein
MKTTTRIAFTLSLTALVAGCSDGQTRSAGTIGTRGGVLSTASGVTLHIAPGALAAPTEIRIVESQPRDGAMARLEVEPHGLALAVPATLTFRVEDGNVKVSEIEHGAEGEVRHALAKTRHDASGEVEVEVEHLAEVELEHGLTCEVACDAGFECDDGVCQAHVEDAADDNGVDPAPAPGTPADDNGVDPAPAPTPAPTPVDDGGGHGPGHT